jgi:hypothetical protein
VTVAHQPDAAAELGDDLNVRLTRILDERHGIGEARRDRLGVNLRVGGERGREEQSKSDGEVRARACVRRHVRSSEIGQVGGLRV